MTPCTERPRAAALTAAALATALLACQGAGAVTIGNVGSIADWASTRASVVHFDGFPPSTPALDVDVGADTVSNAAYEDPANGLAAAGAEAAPYLLRAFAETDAAANEWRAIARFRDELSVGSTSGDDVVLDFVFDVTGTLDPNDPAGHFAMSLFWYEDPLTAHLLDSFIVTSADVAGTSGEVSTTVTLSTGLDSVASGSLLPIHVVADVNAQDGFHDFFGTAALSELVVRDVAGNRLGDDAFLVTSSASPGNPLVNIGSAGQAVPEPGTLVLVATALALAGRRRQGR